MSDFIIQQTLDNSNTVYSSKYKATYHSSHGAVQESMHVFIQQGLKRFKLTNIKKLKIFEMGFGTGLNFMLTLMNKPDHLSIVYHTLELHPIPFDIIENLHFESIEGWRQDDFHKIHKAPSGHAINLQQDVLLTKFHKDLNQFVFKDQYDLVYYDAFGPGTQPELWTETILEKVARTINKNGLLVTYCCQGEFRRILNRLGMIVEKVPGPPGKREMVVATKR